MNMVKTNYMHEVEKNTFILQCALLLIQMVKLFKNDAKKWSDTALTRMWANAQPDGHPAKYRWHPVLNAAHAHCSTAVQ